jgi:nucleotide-binding universal stress UspA family protein
MNNIVLGYDDTEASKRALERAAQLAKAFDAQLTVTSVVPVSVSGPNVGAFDPAEPPAKHAEEAAHARQYLEAQGIKAAYQGMVGEPADGIVELAQQRGADLIVVGSSHLGVAQRLFGRSVSDAVSHKADCDVLIVR